MNTAPREPWKHTPKSPETRAKIAATLRGNTNRRNGKRRAPETLRRAVPVYFPPAVLAALDAHLTHAGGSRSKFIARAVAAALGIDEQGKPAA